MNTIIIPIHSFVDLVTNSSSETFVAATNKTVTTAKEIVNNLLALSKDARTFDDLFLIDIVYEVDSDRYNERAAKLIRKIGKKVDWSYYLTKGELKQVENELKQTKEEGDSDDEDGYEDFTVESVTDPYEGYPVSSLSITVKPGLSEEDEKLAKVIAKKLEGFAGTYSIESTSNY